MRSTLRAYFDCGTSKAAAAKQLLLHEKTVATDCAGRPACWAHRSTGTARISMSRWWCARRCPDADARQSVHVAAAGLVAGHNGVVVAGGWSP